VITELKKFYQDNIELMSDYHRAPIKPENLPIIVAWYVYRMPGIPNWDLDNLWIYRKAFMDVLVDMEIIPDDTIRYVTGQAGPHIIPVEFSHEEKFIFRLRVDQRKETKEWLKTLT
jgi:hypothetical protein